ncbi:hypothetical protein PACILC2_21140 [Paenibacillus cisolokensis]|uniref:NTP pyrophosphohydrolase MazG putative catalytic core domain-containing protein n=1 Tax=Paenibacillus cisolokensis TaxID=1658519 RepID=A0ABQ4N5W0_9BACL|nr:hypothetical protein [Paenibacillus cisolokensis]GIQ63546.1 hypothetical protein PACILC2_21140 [Paenibacillus cisolokensis]
MREYLKKKELLKWLDYDPNGDCNVSKWQLRNKIQSGAFDAPEMEHINAYRAREGLIKRQQEEVQRLRAALEQIANYERDEYESDLVVYAKCKRIAIKALSTTEPTETQRESLRSEVQWFAQQMEAKLRDNDHKGGWENESLLWLYMRMIEEVEEVKAEIKAAFDREIDYNKIIREAADVANFAMMIADNARRINAPEKEE